MQDELLNAQAEAVETPEPLAAPETPEAPEAVETPEAPDAPESDAPDLASALAEAQSACQEMEARLADATHQADEYLSLAQRVQADFDNFRRRNSSVRKDAFDEGARAFAATLLPVLDNFERALAAAQEESPLREGVQMVYRQMTECFEKRGIETIDRLGEPFDPNLENAVMRGTPEEGEPGTVCAVFQKGYRMGDMVIRHAMVKVVPD